MGGYFSPGQGYFGQAALTRNVALTDQGLVFSEGVGIRKPRTLSDIALVLTDSILRQKGYLRYATDVALVVTSSITTNKLWWKAVSDVAFDLTDTIGMLKGHTLPIEPPAPDVDPQRKLAAMLSDLQPELTEDPIILSTLRALGSELERFEQAADAIRQGFFPGWTDDRYRLLSLWEQFFGLPVAQNGMSLEERRNFVEAHFRKRLAGAGSDWEAALTKAMGTTEYVYREGPAPYFVNITYPFAEGAPNSMIVQGLAREITPAHLALGVGYTQGWLVGISLIGDLL